MCRKNTLIFLLACMAFLPACQHETIAPDPTGLYFPRVRSIVQQHCTITCHAPSAGFPDGQPTVLETDEAIVAAAMSIKASVADPVTPYNHRMPPEDTLSATDIDLIVTWAGLGGLSTISPPQ